MTPARPRAPSPVRAALLVAAVAACATPPKPLWVAAHPLRPSVIVTLTVPEQGPVDVEVRVPAAAVPPQAFTQPARFLRVADDHGARALTPPLTALTVTPGADFVLRYAVDVAALDDEAVRPSLDLPFRTGDRAYLPLWALLPDLTQPPWAAFETAEVRVVAKEQVTSSLAQADDAFVAQSAQALYDALFLVGPPHTHVGALTIASTTLPAPLLAQVGALVGRGSTTLAARLGPQSRLKFLALHAAPVRQTSEPWVTGRNFGTTSAAFVDATFDGSASALDGQMLLHELVHAFLPADEALPHWITEGFTEYFALELVLELDRLPPDALFDALAQRWDAFVAAAPQRRALENTLGDYYGGAVLAYCIDTRLRRDGHTLAKVLAKAQRRATAGRVVNDLWEQEIALASAPAGALVLAAKTDPLAPIHDCFTEAGLARVAPRAALKTAVIAQALRLTSRELDPRRLDVRIAQVAQDSPLRAGDVIRATAGQRTLGWDHWAEQLARECAAGGAVALDVLRGGGLVHVGVTLPACGANDLVPSPRQVWTRARAGDPTSAP